MKIDVVKIDAKGRCNFGKLLPILRGERLIVFVVGWHKKNTWRSMHLRSRVMATSSGYGTVFGQERQTAAACCRVDNGDKARNKYKCGERGMLYSVQ